MVLTLTGEKEVVQIGPQDERPSPGSQASDADGASTESAPDTVQLRKNSRDQADASSGDETHGDSPRSLSPSGTFPLEDSSRQEPLARAPSSTPTVTPKSLSAYGDSATRTGASPTGAWPADAHPISLSDSVFTPWSARRASAPDSEDSTSAGGQPDRASEGTAALAGPSARAGDEDEPSVSGSADSGLAAVRLTKRPATGETGPAAGEKGAATPGSGRAASTSDPLSGPWPSFTRQTAWDAEPASPLGAPAAPAFAAPPWRVTVDATAAPLGPDTSDDDQSGGSEPGDAGDAILPPTPPPALAPVAADLGPAAGAGGFDGGSGAAGVGDGGPGGGGPIGPTGPAGRNRPARRGRLGTVIGIAAGIVGLVIAGGIYLYVQKPSPARAAAGEHPAAKTHSPVPKVPEHVVSITPADGTTAANGGADIRVEFSAPLSPTSPMPTLKPAIHGTWLRDGNSAVFVPDRGFKPRTKVTIRVPAGGTGVTSTGGGLLAAPVTAKFRIGKYNGIRMEQLLAQLGYLPLTWSPLSGSSPSTSDARAQVSAAYEPPAGTYTWQAGYPSRLTRLWRPDKPSLILKGAVMAFEADHHLMLDGVIGSQVWRAMFKALAKGRMNTHGYTYAVASQKVPETLTVWHNGQVIFHHLANTGIPVAPTAVGTDPVYLRYRTQIMRGRNPDGTKYADPVAWVAYFHAGEAVHYFPRYSYGSQQSLGCVELPYKPAKRIWPYLTFGTLVTVTAP